MLASRNQVKKLCCQADVALVLKASLRKEEITQVRISGILANMKLISHTHLLSEEFV